ncbi:hypothetical protein SDJN03_18562, partial [Cucurbita argyrosperma subsp. sororia]
MQHNPHSPLSRFYEQTLNTLSNSVFHFYCDWPEHLLPSLGFSSTKLSQIGDPDAHFGLMHDPLNLFNKIAVYQGHCRLTLMMENLLPLVFGAGFWFASATTDRIKTICK